MGLKDEVTSLSLEDWLYLGNINHVLDFSVRNLTILKKTLTVVDTLTPLYGDNPRYAIDPQYDVNYPESKKEYSRALSILNEVCPWQYELFKNIISQICPITHSGKERFDGGASDYKLIGMIFTGVKPHPNHILSLAISLSHELGHNTFMLYQAGQYPVQEIDFKKEVYSGVRKKNRPALASLHACVALGYMISFCESALHCLSLDSSNKDYLEKEILKYKIGIHDGIRAMNEIKLNDLGKLVLDELSNTLKH
jgi:HEXXH motif-containing protein